MKGKSELIILIAVIAVAALYLVTRETDRENFELPTLSAISADTIDRVEIAGPKAAITLKRGESVWQVTPGDFPVDTHKIEGILESITDLAVTDLVSEAKAYDRYDLTGEKMITVTAFSGDRPVRRFALGKTAPTFAHTYIRIEDDPAVYQARGDFRRKFDRDSDGLRDKIILKFEPDAAEKVTLTGLVADPLVLTRTTAASADPEKKSVETWTTGAGNTANATDVDRLLMTLHRLECRQFLDVPPTAAPMIQVVVDAGDAPVALDIFPKTDDKADHNPARSSQNNQAFTLPEGVVTMLRTLALKLFEFKPSELKADPQSASPKPAG